MMIEINGAREGFGVIDLFPSIGYWVLHYLDGMDYLPASSWEDIFFCQ